MPFQMMALSCGRNFSRSVKTRVSHIYWRSAIHTMPLSMELLQCVLAKLSLQYRSLVYLKKQPQKHPSWCQNDTCQHPPGCDNCPAQGSVCKGCLKKGHWQAKCCSSKNSQSTALVDNQSKGMLGWHGRKGKKANLVGVHTVEPPCDEFPT